MPRKKSESRKLAELVARQRGIKVKSAQDWLRRISTGKVKKPKFELKTDYAKRKVRQYVKKEKAAIKKAKAAPIAGIPEARPKRGEYGPGVYTLRVFAEFNFYGSDRRERAINLRLSGKELNEFVNADGPEYALQTLTRTKRNQFLQGADISNLGFFSIDGESIETSEFFD